ncbi:Bcr/CflA family efflux MFS transporter [Tardiphaga alba]|uniref:Bcr/CflA family efflux transporter n=1 Tax=Tardiphaga alba TaxID=340268 RepID=A0ABX8A9A6_9BRAD|nr:multidrug effflux MFS transporter [Tardiphaga alba]QUS40313.1 Bcr/CflA family efflux MFS transporter [Tardiphaga alba]
MTDQAIAAPADTPTQQAGATAGQIAVLAALASVGTLATNILLPSLPQMAATLQVTTPAVTASITIFLVVFALGQLVVGPISDRYGRRLPVLAGFAVFIAGSVWCGLATDLPALLVGRAIQAAGACATSVLSRAIARDMFSGAALARVLTIVMIAQAAAPGFSPLLGGGLDHVFGWRSEFVFVGIFALVSAIAFAVVLGETHHATRIPLNPIAIGTTYGKLSTNRHFLIPAVTVSLIMGGLFSLFSAAPRVLIEGYGFTPIALGLFFAGTVMVVFGSGMLAARLAPRVGLERAIRYGLLIAFVGGVALLAAAVLHANVATFIAATCIFLLGMGVVNPLGTAQTLSPFGTHAGAASALLGFWQMTGAAIGVFLVATIVPDALLALGIVLTGGCLLAVLLYAMRAPVPAP